MKPFAVADNFIVIMAVRYALGRMTSAPAHVARWIIDNIENLSETTARNIVEEITDAERFDDAHPPEPGGLDGGMLGDRGAMTGLRNKVQALRVRRGWAKGVGPIETDEVKTNG